MRSERIQIGEDYYVLASALAPRRPKVFLSHGPGFAIFDHAGDVPLAGTDPFGLFHHGTRFLDRWELRIDGDFPILLSSAPTADGAQLVTWVSNTDRRHDGEVVLERDALAVQRRKALCGGVLYERLDVRSFIPRPVTVTLSILFAADFADEFEVRGVERARRGTVEPPRLSPSEVRFDYEGLDGVSRGTRIVFARTPTVLDERTARFVLSLPPKGATTLRATIACRVGDAEPVPGTFDDRGRRPPQAPRRLARAVSRVDVLERSVRRLGDAVAADLAHAPHRRAARGVRLRRHSLVRDRRSGATALITALETLAFAPELAAASCAPWPRLQGREHRPERDEEPGKILHELREGEMAATGEVPFGRYYGSVDATPLFVVLLAAYAERTGDVALVRGAVAARRSRPWSGCEHQLTTTATASSTYAAPAPDAASSIRVGRTRTTRHPRRRHAGRARPSRWPRCRHTSTRALVGMAGLARAVGPMRDGVALGSSGRGRCGQRFDRDFWLEDQGTLRAGARRRRTPVPRRQPRTPANACSAASPSPSAPPAWPRGSCATTCFCGWGSARSPSTRCASTR